MTTEDNLPVLTSPPPSQLMEFPPEKIDLLRRTICEKLDNDELELFLAQCKIKGLDPVTRQIVAIKRWNGQQQREVMTIQVTVDGLRLIADRTGRYVPGRDTEFRYDEKNHLVSATAYIKKMVCGEWHEIAATARWDEYCQRGKQGQVVGVWASMPHVMLSKAAESMALRRAFPNETSGLYSNEEMMQADSADRAHVPAISPSSATPYADHTMRPSLPPAKVTPDQPRRLTKAEVGERARKMLAERAAQVDMETGEVIDAEPATPKTPVEMLQEEVVGLLLEIEGEGGLGWPAGARRDWLTHDPCSEDEQELIASRVELQGIVELRRLEIEDEEADEEAAQAEKPPAEQPERAVCESCGVTLTRGQYEVSTRAYGKPLCPTHQKEASRASR